MPKLPDESALGRRPSPRPTRGVSRTAGNLPTPDFRMPDTAGQIGDAIGGAVDSITRGAERLREDRTRVELARAKSRFSTEQIKAAADLRQDPDYTTYQERYTERLNQARDEAAEMITDESARQFFVTNLQDDYARGQAKIQGLAYERERDAGRASLSETLSMNRQTALLSDDPVERADVVQATHDEIDAALAAGYISEQEAQSQRRQWSEDYATSFVGMQDPAARIDMLDQGEGVAKLIPADKRVTMRRQAVSERDRMLASERAEVRDLSRDHIASIQQTGEGLPGFEQRARAVLDPEDWEGVRADIDLARDFHGAWSGMRFADPETMREELQRFRPEPGTEGFADRQRMFETLQTAAQQEMRERLADPAGHAMQMPEVRQRFEGESPSLESAISVRMQAQRDMGLTGSGVRALSEREAEGAVREIQDLDPSMRAEKIVEMQNVYGRHWDRAFVEMVDAGLDPQNAVLASVAGNDALSQTMAQVIQLGPAELRKGLDTTIVNDIEASVRDELVDFRQAFEAGDATGGAAAQVNGITGVVQDLAVQYYRQTGDQTDAVTRATNQVILDRFHVVNDDRLRAYIPRVHKGQRVSIGAVEDTTDLRQQREMVEAFDPLPIDDKGFVQDAPEFIDRERTIRAAVNSGYWVTNETGDGLVLMVPFEGGGALPLINGQGERYEVTLDEALRARPGREVPAGELPERQRTGEAEARRGEARQREAEFEQMRQRAQ